MRTPRLTRDARETLTLIERATGVSPRFIRKTSRGHLLFDFAGFQTTISATPSDGRAFKNTVSQIRAHLDGRSPYTRKKRT